MENPIFQHFCTDILLKTNTDTDFVSGLDLYDQMKKWNKENSGNKCPTRNEFLSYFERTNPNYNSIDKKLYRYTIKSEWKDKFVTDFMSILCPE